MPEVPEILEENLPAEIREHFARARAGQITVPAFLESLEAHKISTIERLLYAVKAFRLPFARVKEIEVQRGRGLTDNDVQELLTVLDELDSERRVAE